MRKFFIPYILLPETETAGILAELDDAEKEWEQREAGSAERTVVHLWHSMICSMAFRSCDLQGRWTRFHLQEQLVWVDLLNLTSKAQSPRPSMETSPLLCPTNTFSSRWNCVLDLAAHQAQALDAMDVSDPSILPEPASPFLVFATNSASSSRTHYTGSGTPTYTAGSTPQASSRRSTLTPGGYFAGISIKGLTPNQSAMFLHPGFAESPLNSADTLHPLYPSPVVATNSRRFTAPLHSLHHNIHLHPQERKQKHI